MTAQSVLPNATELVHLPANLQAAFEGWDGGLGAIDGRDATFLYNLIRRVRPKSLVEIGTASGFSAALMSLMLAAENLGDSKLACYDLLGRFFLDKSKPVGFLIAEIAGEAAGVVTINPGHTSISAAPLHADRSIDLCFIDANHRHPWALIDALMLLPKIADGGVMVFHDPMAMRLPTNRFDVGPKVVLGSASQDLVIPTAALLPEGAIAAPTRRITDNIFAVHCPADRTRLALDLSDGFLMPWTLMHQMDLKTVIKVANRLEAHWPDQVAEAFRWAAERHYARNWA